MVLAAQQLAFIYLFDQTRQRHLTEPETDTERLSLRVDVIELQPICTPATSTGALPTKSNLHHPLAFRVKTSLTCRAQRPPMCKPLVHSDEIYDSVSRLSKNVALDYAPNFAGAGGIEPPSRGSESRFRPSKPQSLRHYISWAPGDSNSPTFRVRTGCSTIGATCPFDSSSWAREVTILQPSD